jgi:hypothetical protein
MNCEIYNRNLNTQGEFLPRIFDATDARVKKGEDQLRRKTRDILTRVAKCIEVDSWIFYNLL